MTDQELDRLMQRVLLDSIALDCGSEETDSTVFEPSQQHRRQMRSMLKDPLGWMRRKSKPVWKLALQRVAVVLLIASLSLGGLMAVSPTVRAAVIRWVTEWYETHIVYRYSGDTISEEMPQYEIAGLPDGYTETERLEHSTSVSVLYESDDGGIICLDYVYMHQGAASVIASDNAVPITVNEMEGQMFLPSEAGETTTVIWIDPEVNIQFTIDATLEKDVILHIAESVCLSDVTNQ